MNVHERPGIPILGSVQESMVTPGHYTACGPQGVMLAYGLCDTESVKYGATFSRA